MRITDENGNDILANEIRVGRGIVLSENEDGTGNLTGGLEFHSPTGGLIAKASAIRLGIVFTVSFE